MSLTDDITMKNLEEVRERIIKAAEKKFSMLGFEKTTLDDITGENGKSKTSIYYHFKNKHEIFKSVIAKEFEDVRSQLEEALKARYTNHFEMMRSYLHTRMLVLERQGAYRHFASSRFAYGENPISKAVADARREFDSWEIAFMEENVSRGISEGEIPKKISPDICARTIINVFKALEIQFFSASDKTEIINTYEGLIELI